MTNAADDVGLDTEKNVTELTIAPDGRVFAFGTSLTILEVLEALRPDDVRVCALIQHVRSTRAQAQDGEVER